MTIGKQSEAKTRKKTMDNPDIKHLVIPFYSSRENYENSYSILDSEDREDLAPYALWKEKVQLHEEAIRASGVTPIRINVVPNELEIWINSNRIRITCSVFGQYAASKFTDRLAAGDLG